MCILPAKSPIDCVLCRFLALWYVCTPAPYCVDHISTACQSDVLAFTLITSSAARLKTRGRKVSVLLATIVEDSTLYFLFIFASQFVFMMILILGRVSTTAPGSPSELQPMTSNAYPCRNQSGCFHRCEWPNIDLVRPFLPCFTFTTPSGNLACVPHLSCALLLGGLPSVQFPPGDDWADNAFVEESGG